MSISLYIHVPFCLKKCNYCNFISYPYQEKEALDYLSGLSEEMKLYGRCLPAEAKEVETVYIGGGTPTCLSADNLATILKNCRHYFYLFPGAEISIEANPGTVDKKKLAILREAGVNRLSIGVQACQQRLLRLLGRVHTYAQVQDTVLTARETGFANINLDLIFGLPEQTLEDWVDCLQQVLEFCPTHISAYGLQLEEGTPLWRDIRAKKLKLCDEETEIRMYERTIEILTGTGFRHYEISNFSKPGKQCRHNLQYWHNLPYLGLGPAAHSFFFNCRFSNEVLLRKYIARLKVGELPIIERNKLTKQAVIEETVFLGLRMIQGLDLEVFARRFGQTVEEVFPGQIKRLLHFNLLEKNNGFLQLTRRGLLLANQVFAEFV